MADDVLLNKAAAIERSVRRAREEYGADDANLLANQTRQDAIWEWEDLTDSDSCPWRKPAFGRHCITGLGARRDFHHRLPASA